MSTSTATAANQGAIEADSAVNAANALGITHSVIYYDLESYGPNCGSNICNSQCNTASEKSIASASAKAFVNSWIQELHNKGFDGGVYGGYLNAEDDWNSTEIANSADAVWLGAWNGYDDTQTPSAAFSLWPSNMRIHQYCNSGSTGAASCSGHNTPSSALLAGNWWDDDAINGPVFSQLGSSQTLSVTLSANQASGSAPLTTDLTATVSGTASGSVNYSFWWNCNDPGTSVSEVEGTCGQLTASCSATLTGFKCDSQSQTSYSINNTYSAAGTYTAKVIAERGSAQPAESRTVVTVSTASSGYFSLNNSGGISVTAGNSGTNTLTVTPLNGFTGSVSFACSVSGSPSGMTCSSPSVYVANPYATSLLTVATTSSTPSGNYTATVTATDTATGKISAVTSFSVTVNAATQELSEPVGTTSGTQTAAISISSSFTLSSIKVLTQGATGLDFVFSNGGTCVVGTSYSIGQSCTVNYTFTPMAPGQRFGAIVIADGSGNAQATQYISGAGTGPQVVLYPGTQTAAVSGLSYPRGVAIDGAGAIYVADSGNNRVVKETLSGGTYSESTVLSGLNEPINVAVDGAGSVYIADPFTNSVLKEMPSGGSYVQIAIGSGLNLPYGVAVDRSGNVYIADTNNNRILKETLSGSKYTQSVVLSSGLSGPTGIAVDSSGNLFILDSASRVLKETLSSGNYTQSTIASGLSSPQSIVMDGGGSLYITTGQSGESEVLKETPSGGSYTQSILTINFNPGGLAMDANGNLFIADTYGARILKMDVSDPPTLTYATTAVGSTSSDSPQTLTVWNIGNAVLSFPIPSSGNNPSISTNFTLNSSGGTACPLTGSAASSPGSLAAGASCDLPISFAPLSAGSLSGAIVLTDNSLNKADTTQPILLSGVATGQATPTVTAWPTASVITYGQTLSSSTLSGGAANYNGTNVPGTFAWATPSTAPSVGTQSEGVTFTPSNTTDYSTATGTVNVTVNKAMLTVTASSASVKYGAAVPAITPSYSGFVNGDTPSSLATVPICTTTYTATSLISGSPYATSCSGAAAANYFFSYVAGTVTVTKATPTVTTWPTASAITYGQTLNSSKLTGGTASVSGDFAWTTPSTQPSAGTQSESVTFTPADTSDYNSVTGSVNVTVNPASQGFMLSASPTSVSVAQGNSATSTVTVSDVGGFSGTVTLSTSGLPSGVTSSFAAGSGAGTQVLTLTASSSTVVTSSPVTVTVTGTSGSLSATTSIALTVTAPPFGPGSGGTTTITVSTGGTGTGTISVVGTNGFSGAVNLSCNVTPSNLNDTPRCTLNPTSVTISGITAQTSMLTVTTTATSNAANGTRKLFWPSAGGTALALVLFFVFPKRRRDWLALVGLLALVASIGAIGCGSSGSSSGNSGGGGTSGTAPGTYTITVTGTSGTINAIVGTITLTVH